MCAYKLVKVEPEKEKVNVAAVILAIVASLAAIAAAAYVICKKFDFTCPICGRSLNDDCCCDCCDDDCDCCCDDDCDCDCCCDCDDEDEETEECCCDCCSEEAPADAE